MRRPRSVPALPPWARRAEHVVAVTAAAVALGGGAVALAGAFWPGFAVWAGAVAAGVLAACLLRAAVLPGGLRALPDRLEPGDAWAAPFRRGRLVALPGPWIWCAAALLALPALAAEALPAVPDRVRILSGTATEGGVIAGLLVWSLVLAPLLGLAVALGPVARHDRRRVLRSAGRALVRVGAVAVIVGVAVSVVPLLDGGPGLLARTVGLVGFGDEPGVGGAARWAVRLGVVLLVAGAALRLRVRSRRGLRASGPSSPMGSGRGSRAP